SAVVILLCLLPLFYFAKYSFTAPTEQGGEETTYTAANYLSFLTDPYTQEVMVRTLIIAIVATVLTVALAIPVARWMSTMSPRWRTLAIIATVFPMLVGDVIRAIGWASLVGYSGIIKNALVAVGVVSPDADLQHTPVTIV